MAFMYKLSSGDKPRVKWLNDSGRRDVASIFGITFPTTWNDGYRELNISYTRLLADHDTLIRKDVVFNYIDLKRVAELNDIDFENDMSMQELVLLLQGYFIVEGGESNDLEPSLIDIIHSEQYRVSSLSFIRHEKGMDSDYVAHRSLLISADDYLDQIKKRLDKESYDIFLRVDEPISATDRDGKYLSDVINTDKKARFVILNEDDAREDDIKMDVVIDIVTSSGKRQLIDRDGIIGLLGSLSELSGGNLPLNVAIGSTISILSGVKYGSMDFISPNKNPTDSITFSASYRLISMRSGKIIVTVSGETSVTDVIYNNSNGSSQPEESSEVCYFYVNGNTDLNLCNRDYSRTRVSITNEEVDTESFSIHHVYIGFRYRDVVFPIDPKALSVCKNLKIGPYPKHMVGYRDNMSVSLLDILNEITSSATSALKVSNMSHRIPFVQRFDDHDTLEIDNERDTHLSSDDGRTSIIFDIQELIKWMERIDIYDESTMINKIHSFEKNFVLKYVNVKEGTQDTPETPKVGSGMSILDEIDLPLEDAVEEEVVEEVPVNKLYLSFDEVDGHAGIAIAYLDMEEDFEAIDNNYLKKFTCFAPGGYSSKDQLKVEVKGVSEGDLHDALKLLFSKDKDEDNEKFILSHLLSALTLVIKPSKEDKHINVTVKSLTLTEGLVLEVDEYY